MSAFLDRRALSTKSVMLPKSRARPLFTVSKMDPLGITYAPTRMTGTKPLFSMEMAIAPHRSRKMSSTRKDLRGARTRFWRKAMPPEGLSPACSFFFLLQPQKAMLCSGATISLARALSAPLILVSDTKKNWALVSFRMSILLKFSMPSIFASVTTMLSRCWARGLDVVGGTGGAGR